MLTENQDEVIAFLSSPCAYEPAHSEVERIDTHSAIVFLVGHRAYKLKRAVQYDYLDFSTRARRAAACRAEYELNRRTAPTLYLGVASVTREADGRLVLGGRGEPVEDVLCMVRFDQDSLFDRLAVRGRLSVEMMRGLADAVAAAHAAAPRRPDHGGRTGIEWVIDGNATAFDEYADILGIDLGREVSRLSREALDRHGDLLDARRLNGHVRECHGDLHLRNIVLFKGRPTLFDAVEFNDRISCVDVMYDLAFLLMDLWRLGLYVDASECFNQYVGVTGEYGALPLLPLFLSCRSAVRAKTNATAARLQSGPGRASTLEEAARTYLSGAERLLRPPPPVLVAIGGLTGTGKTTLARRVAPLFGAAPGAIVLRSDVIRKELFHTPWSERLDNRAYAPEVSTRVYALLIERAATALRAGHSVIVDAVFADSRERTAIRDAARGAGVPFAGCWLEASFDASAARILRRTADASDATVEVLQAQTNRPLGSIDWLTLDASGDIESVERQLEDRLQFLGIGPARTHAP